MSQDADLICEVVRWVSDEPQPGWVEAVFTDSYGRICRFFDKPPIFESPDSAPITRDSHFPVAAVLQVEVVEDGDPVLVTTRYVDSEEGEHQFRVPASALMR